MLDIVKRKLAIVRKRSSKFRSVIPNKVIRNLKWGEKKTLNFYKKYFCKVKYKSEFTNVYHIALQKTGTQWIQDVLLDPIVYKYSGMTVDKFGGCRRKSQAHPIRGLNEPFEKNSIVSTISGTYKNYQKDIPKNDGKNAVFFVIRDPREMVVSWYFSTKNSHIIDHGTMHHVLRNKLREKSKKEGLRYTIDLFDWKGKFEVMRSWMDKDRHKNIKIVKFEDLTQDSLTTFKNLFNFIDVRIPEDSLKELIHSYSFEVLTGRDKGKEEESSHMRKGNSKSWKKHLDGDLISLLNTKASDIIQGYCYE
ncbi:sulfotransferase domain-containing protein [Salinibacter ruber]|uniref:sulfotransferase domain-containing protein n=1 Tax=Salinibacter ruber TaxID=146919 RepID=UPI002073B7E3|nr:sulfotransferase domain-containing protein [Salinibacter ruber]